MLIVGERINTSRTVAGVKEIENAVLARNAEVITALAREQAEDGATYIDINAGTLSSGEPEALAWLTGVVSTATDAPICFDSPNPTALTAALQEYAATGKQPMVNSISAEAKRYAKVLPIVKEFGAKVIALAMDDSGIQADATLRLAVARALVARLLADGVPAGDIYLDPLTFPIGTGDDTATTFLQIVRTLHTEFPEIHIIAGLSNVSHGMPARRILNQAMTLLALANGLDAGILDPHDKHLMALITAAEALLGRDEYCMEYIGKARAGEFAGM